MELKTLKDIEFGSNEVPDELSPEFEYKVATSGQLKAEAIKWIKTIETPTKRGEGWDLFELPGNFELSSNYDENDYNGAKSVLMSFFNITEGDLD